MRIVASLTTMPDRYSKVVKTLESLRKQTYKLDAIYLSLPERSRRLNIEYPPIPSEISNLCTIIPCTDFGPITKILGGLLAEDDPNTVIITFDDDMIYPEDLVEALVNHHRKYPNSAIGSSGMSLKYNFPMCALTLNEDIQLYRIFKSPIPVESKKIDSVYGYSGALYVRKFFPVKERLEEDFLNYALVNDDMFMNDDIVISGYLSLQNIERRIFTNMPNVGFVIDQNTGRRIRTNNEISYNVDKFFQRLNRSIETCKSLGMYSQCESVDISDTVIGISTLIVVCLLIIILLAIYIIMSPFASNIDSSFAYSLNSI